MTEGSWNFSTRRFAKPEAGACMWRMDGGTSSMDGLSSWSMFSKSPSTARSWIAWRRSRNRSVPDASSASSGSVRTHQCCRSGACEDVEFPQVARDCLVGHVRSWRSGHRGDSGQLLDGGIDPRLRKLDVLQLACEVRVIRRHVEVAMPRQAKEDGPLLTSLSSGGRLLSHGPQCMRRLGSRQEALAAGEPHGLGEAFVAFVGPRRGDHMVAQHAE